MVSIAVARRMSGGSLDCSLGLWLGSVDGSTGRGIGPLGRIWRGGDLGAGGAAALFMMVSSKLIERFC